MVAGLVQWVPSVVFDPGISFFARKRRKWLPINITHNGNSDAMFFHRALILLNRLSFPKIYLILGAGGNSFSNISGFAACRFLHQRVVALCGTEIVVKWREYLRRCSFSKLDNVFFSNFSSIFQGCLGGR